MADKSFSPRSFDSPQVRSRTPRLQKQKFLESVVGHMREQASRVGLSLEDLKFEKVFKKVYDRVDQHFEGGSPYPTAEAAFVDYKRNKHLVGGPVEDEEDYPKSSLLKAFAAVEDRPAAKVVTSTSSSVEIQQPSTDEALIPQEKQSSSRIAEAGATSPSTEATKKLEHHALLAALADVLSAASQGSLNHTDWLYFVAVAPESLIDTLRIMASQTAAEFDFAGEAWQFQRSAESTSAKGAADVPDKCSFVLKSRSLGFVAQSPMVSYMGTSLGYQSFPGPYRSFGQPITFPESVHQAPHPWNHLPFQAAFSTERVQAVLGDTAVLKTRFKVRAYSNGGSIRMCARVAHGLGIVSRAEARHFSLLAFHTPDYSDHDREISYSGRELFIEEDTSVLPELDREYDVDGFRLLSVADLERLVQQHQAQFCSTTYSIVSNNCLHAVLALLRSLQLSLPEPISGLAEELLRLRGSSLEVLTAWLSRSSM